AGVREVKVGIHGLTNTTLAKRREFATIVVRARFRSHPTQSKSLFEITHLLSFLLGSLPLSLRSPKCLCQIDAQSPLAQPHCNLPRGLGSESALHTYHRCAFECGMSLEGTGLSHETQELSAVATPQSREDLSPSRDSQLL